ncbi:MAG: sulfatase-like hydrolase/transferase, partial [Gemmatimonadota bacterium]
MLRFAARALGAGWTRGVSWTLLPALLCLGCGGPAPLTVDMPLHLEEHLDAAVIVGSEIPPDVPQPVEWSFDEPQPGWIAAPPPPFPAGIQPAGVSQTDEALRIALGPSNERSFGWLLGGVCVDVPEWDHRDWAEVLIRAQSTGPGFVGLAFNVRRREGILDDESPGAYEATGGDTPVIGDSTVHTYQLAFEPDQAWDEPVRQFCLTMASRAPFQLEILSISVLPVEASFADKPAGILEVERGQNFRRTLFVHTPARVQYRVRVPEGGRLDTGLGILRPGSATRFRVTVAPEGAPADTLLDESYSDRSAWGQRSLDFSEYGGQTVTLSLEAESEVEGSVALWGAPTLTGFRTTDKPNVIFYIIDGAGAEYLSVYGYNRRTTPNLERLAAEGALFERAYSNSSWTLPSTTSFMTSLQTSVMGGAKGGYNLVPENARTMAQHMHAAGYQTGVFTANPNAGRLGGLERGVDSFQEGWTAFSYYDRNWNRSSSYLHESFWRWRETYPREPYWGHFQTVDIHGDFPAPAPFGGLFVSAEEARLWGEWRNRFQEEGLAWTLDRDAFETLEVDRVAFFTLMQGMYDEALAYNDYQIGRLVERLKAVGEWENTLLVIAADHSIAAAAGDLRYFREDSLPPSWAMRNPYFRPSISRVPLMFIWPGHIQAGQRFSEPAVSMIDVLPTILDLAGLPFPDVVQGRSLAPLLLGTGGVENRPVILDEFDLDQETGELRGILEVIDGRWGASLEINPWPPGKGKPEMWRRPVPFLLFDLWNDPYCLHSLHEERPDLVEKYTAFLEAQWEA